MHYTISQLKQHLNQRVYDIYDIFKDFFGENYVDLQNMEIPFLLTDMQKVGIKDIDISKEEKEYEVSDEMLQNLEKEVALHKVTLYVWWPRVIVSNEYGKSIVIQDLYAKIEVQRDGRIPYENRGFLLNRSTYTETQFSSNYLHSHISSIPNYDFTYFMPPCLGTGPIRDTIDSLKNDFDPTFWMLFCKELSLYVTVESISGGPYRRLENVGKWQLASDYKGYRLYAANSNCFIDYFSKNILKDFIQYYLQHGNLSINFKNSCFTWGMDYYDYILDISNSFIDFYNKYLCSDYRVKDCFSKGILVSIYAINRKFCRANNLYYPNSFNGSQGKHVLTFKGKDIKLKIIKETLEEDTPQPIAALHNNVAMFILKNILRTINFRYTNEYNNKCGESESSASTPKEPIYI